MQNLLRTRRSSNHHHQVSPLTFPTTAKATDKERQSENQKLQNRLETNSKQLI